MAVDKIKERISIPLIADIHFNYRLALMCAQRGIDALRINPGNIGGEEKVKAVAEACRRRNIPIRIGVNGGSLEKELRAKYGGVTAGGAGGKRHGSCAAAEPALISTTSAFPSSAPTSP